MREPDSHLHLGGYKSITPQIALFSTYRIDASRLLRCGRWPLVVDSGMSSAVRTLYRRGKNKKKKAATKEETLTGRYACGELR